MVSFEQTTVLMINKILTFFLGLAMSMAAFSQNRVKIIDDSHEALQIRLDLIRNAETEILISTYIFTQDSIAKFFLSELQIAAERGVKVKVLIDGLNKYFRPKILKYLNRLGIEVHYYNVFKGFNLGKFTKYRLHSKIFLTDNKYAIIGGRNMGSEYYGLNHRNFRDRDILINGPDVNEIREVFFEFYHSGLISKSKQWPFFTCLKSKKQCAKRDTRLIHDLFSVNQAIIEREVLRDASECLWQNEFIEVDSFALSYDKPGLNKYSSGTVAKDLISTLAAAKDTVIIQSPYLILTDELYHLLYGLSKMNTEIKILTNSNLSTDGILAQSAYINGREEIFEMGVKLYEFRGLERFHSKSMIVDDISLVGSMNIDPRSLNLNKEIAAFIKGQSFKTALQKSMANDFLSSTQLTEENEPIRSPKLIRRIFVNSLRYFIVPRINPFL